MFCYIILTNSKQKLIYYKPNFFSSIFMNTKNQHGSRQFFDADDDAPRSNCSIEAENQERRLAFNIWPDHNKAKQSHKEISDRFLPLRKAPASSKNLIMQGPDEDMIDEISDKRGISVTDLYKM